MLALRRARRSYACHNTASGPMLIQERRQCLAPPTKADPALLVSSRACYRILAWCRLRIEVVVTEDRSTSPSSPDRSAFRTAVRASPRNPLARLRPGSSCPRRQRRAKPETVITPHPDRSGMSDSHTSWEQGSSLLDDRQQLSPFPSEHRPISPRAVPNNPSLRQAAGPLVGHSARR
jgi:hypothetical protein